MASDPLKELIDMLEGSQICIEESLPRAITGPRQISAQIQVKRHNVAVELWDFLREWFESWLTVVLTGSVTGAAIGFVYRWILLPN